MKLKRLFGVSVSLCFAGAFSAQALEFVLDQPLPGAPALAPNTWLKLLITDNLANPNNVDVTFTGNLGSQKVGDVYLNFDPTLIPFLLIDPSQVLQQSAFLSSIQLGQNVKQLPGDGDFDVIFGFNVDNNNAFSGTDFFTVTLLGKDGANLDPSNFDFTSEQKGGNSLFGYKAGAHIQSLPGGGSTSIIPGNPVPEAVGTVMLLGFSLLGLAMFRGKLQ